MSVSIFFCYAHEDELFLNKLKASLRPLQRQGLIDFWHDRDISAGTEWEYEISQRLNEAKIILLLVSPDFMNSDYCYSVEMKYALERHDRKEAIVIPVILRPIYWQGLLGKLQALPTDAKPVIDRYWQTLDEAIYDIAEGIRTVVGQLDPKPVSPSDVLPSQASKREFANVSLDDLSTQPVTPLSSLKPEDVSLFSTLKGHTSAVSGVAISPDGQILASASFDGTIKLWHLASGEEQRTLKRDALSFKSVVFSPNNHILASGSLDGTIKLWNVANGKVQYTLNGHTSTISSVAISPDGRTLASGSQDKTIKLWNLTNGREQHTLKGHINYVLSVAFSPDGQTLASGCADGTIKLWNVASGKEQRTLKGHRGVVESVAFSPDGHILASGSSDDKIKLWHLASGKEHSTLLGNWVYSLAFSPDGQTLASGCADGTIKLWGKK